MTFSLVPGWPRGGFGTAWRRVLWAPLASAMPLLASAGAPPVGAVRLDPKIVQRELTGSVLTTGEPSRSTRNILFLSGLGDTGAK